MAMALHPPLPPHYPTTFCWNWNWQAMPNRKSCGAHNFFFRILRSELIVKKLNQSKVSNTGSVHYMLSRLWSEWGTGQDGGARPKFLQGKVCHCFANLLWFFSNILPLAVSQHLMAACQCQNKLPAHFLLQIIAIIQSQFLKCGAKKNQMKKMNIFKRQFLNFFNAANQEE